MKTLVLNASYEPLGVISTRRAVMLVLAGKASTIAGSGAQLHSRSLVLDAPSVVLLNQYIRVPHRRIPLTRKSALERYGHVCAYCGKFGDTLDHVIPRARGGTHTWDNVVKSDRMLADLGWKLPFELKEPHLNMASLISMRWDDPSWDEYTEPWRRHELQLAG